MKRLLATILPLLASSAAATDIFNFTPSGSLSWTVRVNSAIAQSNQTLHVVRGQTYDFKINSNSAHPFYVMTVKGTNTANAYSGFSGNGTATTTSVTVPFLIPANAPDTLFYDCSIHSSMAGTIAVSIFRDGFE
jgi:hypothetical protein